MASNVHTTRIVGMNSATDKSVAWHLNGFFPHCVGALAAFIPSPVQDLTDRTTSASDGPPTCRAPRRHLGSLRPTTVSLNRYTHCYALLPSMRTPVSSRPQFLPAASWRSIVSCSLTISARRSLDSWPGSKGAGRDGDGRRDHSLGARLWPLCLGLPRPDFALSRRLLAIRGGRLRGRPRRLLRSLQPQQEVDQFVLRKPLQITAIHICMNLGLEPAGKGVSDYDRRFRSPQPVG